jgi:uncharacterized membrane protein YkgB
MKRSIVFFDRYIITTLQRIAMPAARIALFIIFFWFGLLKVIGASPAGPLVSNLLEQTIPFISPATFIFLFGFFEMLIGILFLIPKMERLAILLLGVHMITTFVPLVFLRETSWQRFLVPTLEGQYIIKNVALIALAIGIAAHLKPMKRK